MSITGKTLIEWGIKPGRHMANLLREAQELWAQMHVGDKADLETVKNTVLASYARLPANNRIGLRKDDPASFDVFLEPETSAEWATHAAVIRDMRMLMQVPTVTRGTIMPDACPAGTIMVGGVVETENAIHPGFHSADICCSLMATFFDVGDECDPGMLLDAGHTVTHFGGGGRARGRQWKPPQQLLDDFSQNPFLKGLVSDAIEHFGTQGDGNHFMFVGRSRATSRVVLVTHHGSRRPGAQLYKAAMKTAREMTREIADGVPDAMAWIPYDTKVGQDYWAALGLIREWTKQSHMAIHAAAAHAYGEAPTDWLWNEHNHVFQREPGKFLHAKGATPAWGSHAPDADKDGRIIIPLNMAEPVLIARGLDKPEALGFAPHGAGRNISRTQHLREAGEDFPREELADLRERMGLDIRFWTGTPDPTELPSAYKSAAAVTAQMESFGLAEVVDWIDPYGCIMAGNWTRPT